MQGPRHLLICPFRVGTLGGRLPGTGVGCSGCLPQRRSISHEATLAAVCREAMLRRFNKRISTQLINPLYQVRQHSPLTLLAQLSSA